MTNHRVPVIDLDAEELRNELEKPLNPFIREHIPIKIVTDSGPIIPSPGQASISLSKLQTPLGDCAAIRSEPFDTLRANG
jgi:hypothetical protein